MTAPDKPSEVLARAADLVEPEGAWIQHELARDANGLTVPPSHFRAVCWCAAGALQKISGGFGAPSLGLALDYAQEVVDLPIAAFNDRKSRTQAEVVAALRAASELARSEGQ